MIKKDYSNLTAQEKEEIVLKDSPELPGVVDEYPPGFVTLERQKIAFADRISLKNENL